MNFYLPEGRLIGTEANRRWLAGPEMLAEAMERHIILEAEAVRCDSDRNLHVRLGGGLTGVIPRAETALGLDDGTTREIAVLCRVGRPVCFRVVGLEAHDGRLTPVLSRRLAQQEAMAALRRIPVGAVLPATVTRLESFGAFVDVGCGLTSMIPIERISVSRIIHPNRRFTVGQQIYAVYQGIDPDSGHILLSHRELLGTWAENATRFSPGETVTGTVRGIQDYGVFVELTPNLTGLAETFPGLAEDQRVSVYLKAIQPERHKIKLLIIDALETGVRAEPFSYFIPGRSAAGWNYYSPLIASQ